MSVFIDTWAKYRKAVVRLDADKNLLKGCDDTRKASALKARIVTLEEDLKDFQQMYQKKRKPQSRGQRIGARSFTVRPDEAYLILREVDMDEVHVTEYGVPKLEYDKEPYLAAKIVHAFVWRLKRDRGFCADMINWLNRHTIKLRPRRKA